MPARPSGRPIPGSSSSGSGAACRSGPGKTYRRDIKLTWAKDAQRKDAPGLFNARLDGNTRRAIDLHDGDTMDAGAFRARIREAMAMNTASGR